MTDEELIALCRSQEYHYDCEDCWYSCPKSGNCCNNTVGDDCTCGYNRRVQEKMDLYRAGYRAGLEAARGQFEEFDQSGDSLKKIWARYGDWLDAKLKG